MEASVSGKEATFTFSDNVGISGYGVNQSNTEEPTYVETNNTNVTWTASSAGTYYIWIKDMAGNKANTSFEVSKSVFSIDVTYVANGIKYTESVNSGQSVLSPNSFTLSKSGTTFVGWSEDSSSTDVLTSKVAEEKDITLYAVWKYNDKTMRSFSANQTIGSYPSFPNAEYADSSKYEAIRIETSGCYLVFSLHKEANTYGTSMQLVVGNKTFYNKWLVASSGTYYSDYISSGTYPGTTLSIYSDYASKYFTSSISFIAVGKKIVS